MTATGLVRETPALLEPLRGLESRLSGIGRAELSAILAPVVERLQEPLDRAELRNVAIGALSFCKQLYTNARSGEALILARAVLVQAAFAQDPVLERLASTVCGLLAADTADVVEAVEHYANALRLVGDDSVEASGIWNNLGLAMGIAGNYEMAGRCYLRAIDLVQENCDPLYPRYVAYVNLANNRFHLGWHAEGLVAADRALLEQNEEFRERDLQVALFLRRNLVRLLVAVGRVEDAAHHVAEAGLLADRIRTARAQIAAATARAVHELALGRRDVGLTRLEGALTSAREVPGALRDTLACVISAEETAGNSERALLRLGELSDHVYRAAIERARGSIELAALAGSAGSCVDRAQQQTRARLISKVAPPVQPESWKALERLAVSAVMRIDKTGWHGKRVGTLSKALAIACGIDPLQALEIGFACELHDIGTLSVPEEILSKPVLSEAEKAIVRRHTDAGAEILGDDRHPRIFLAREIARYHHAHWDGAGHPERVGGRFIPQAARICAIADAYDEMVSGLDGETARSMEDALAALRREAGRRFDPELVARFDHMVRAESEDLGVDLQSASGMEAFEELVNALQEDRGFV
ncbi:MAG TPA: HD domain-containing phosphohydrolase [Usitatibacter sp.]|nr:HD domain-containing phosphohydrolase [Usitatibacter sp.]